MRTRPAPYIHGRIPVDVVDDVFTEDVLQEVRIAVWLETPAAPSSHRGLLPLVRGIARRKLSDRVHDARLLKNGGQTDPATGRRRRPKKGAALLRAVCPRRTPAQEALHRELLNRLRAACALLDAPHRAVITLHYYDGLSRDEIAKEMHAPLRAIKQLLAEALARLRKYLADDSAPHANLAQIAKAPQKSSGTRGAQTTPQTGFAAQRHNFGAFLRATPPQIPNYICGNPLILGGPRDPRRAHS